MINGSVQRRIGPLRILVVEDDPDTLELMIQVLAMTGDHTIRGASNAEEGIRALRSSPCDLLLTDIGLPGVSGLEMIDRAKREDLLRKTAILVCSAHEELRQEVVLSGASFIAKPVAFEKLWDAMSNSERLSAESIEANRKAN